MMAPIATAAAATHPFTVVALGTSLTASSGWPKALEGALHARGCPARVAVVAKAGMDSHWGLAQLGRVVALRPRMVLVEFAANDAALTHLMSLAASRATMRAISSRLHGQLPGTQVMVMGMSPAWGPRGWIRPWLNRFTDAHLNDAATGGDATIDFRGDWARIPADARTAMIPDGTHPTSAAAIAIMVPRLTDAIATHACHAVIAR